MATKEKSPKLITIYGRLSFPSWTAQETYEKSLKGKFPDKDVASAKPNFNLLLEQAQLDKLVKHCVEVFLPYCEAQGKDDSKDGLTSKEVKDLIAQIENDFDGPYNTPFSQVNEKTLALVPEAVASVKCIGNKGTDIELKAIVNNEQELVVPDPDLLTFPVIRPIAQTVHDMYPGAYVAATLNLYSYHNGKLPGFSAGAGTAVFKMDGDRIGGGVSVDEDEIFMD